MISKQATKHLKNWKSTLLCNALEYLLYKLNIETINLFYSANDLTSNIKHQHHGRTQM